jgi:hypothetical protein
LAKSLLDGPCSGFELTVPEWQPAPGMGARQQRPKGR